MEFKLNNELHLQVSIALLVSFCLFEQFNSSNHLLFYVFDAFSVFDVLLSDCKFFLFMTANCFVAQQVLVICSHNGVWLLIDVLSPL